ncbi:hypothetical protein KSP35_09570 [Aquihabitans sp. G128]|uniref:hypothetical protein n=1 Tax=Aquihabitans sp. G128 TaxID=2849779 RepID=UPI001C2310D4|nr:hypothetical protein [Aquihabitans sp. G128]QXC63002.1 hypothetical protein KSP35_09570 [Aquihabitans sp. G128]
MGQGSTAYVYGNPFSSHPGPMAFYAIGAFTAVLGTTTGGFAFALALNAVAVAVAGWAGLRVAGFRGAAVFLGAAAAVGALAIPGFLASVNITYVCVVPMFACLALSAAVAEADWRALPPLVVLATFVGQTEAVYAIPLVPVLLVAPLAGWWRGRAARRPASAAVAPAVGASAIALALWAPVAYDQLRGSGNLGKVLTASIPSRGWSGASQAWGTLLSVPPQLSTAELLASSELQRLGAGSLVGIAVVVGLLAWRRAHLERFGGVLAVAAATFLAAGAAGASLPDSDATSWHLLWIRTDLFFLVAVLVLVGLPTSFAARPRARVATAVVGSVLSLALVVAGSWIRPAGTLNDEAMEASYRLVGPVASAIRPGRATVLANRGLWSDTVSPALAVRLEDRDRPVTFTRNPLPDTDEVLVVTRGEAIGVPGSVRVARVPARPGAAARARRLAAVVAWLRANGPISLGADAGVDLPALADGLVPELCVAEVLAEPDRVLDLPPSVVAGLVQLGRVSTPEPLPAALSADVEAWAEGLGTEVWRLPRPRPVGGDPASDLLLSRSSC